MASASGDSDETTTVSFGCDYAKSDNAKCHGKNCQNEISKGTLRLSRLIANPFIPQSSTRAEQLMPVYYHVQCLINYLRSGHEKKKRLNNIEKDLQGFNELKKSDQNQLKKIFGHEEQIKGKLSDTSSSAETTYLEHNTEKKYWQISIDNKTTKTKYGLLDEEDSNAIILYKDFSSKAEAQKYVDKKVQEKTKYGYQIKKQGGAASTVQATTATAEKRKRSPTATKTTTAKRQRTTAKKPTATRKQPARTSRKNAK